MFKTLTQDLLELGFLPIRTQAILAAIFIGLILLAALGWRGQSAARTLESEWRAKAQQAESRAAEFEKRADEQSKTSADLQEKLDELGNKSKIAVKEFDDARADYNRIRNSPTGRNTSADELRRNLCELYPTECADK